MKISPMAQGGQPGQALNAVNVGRTADPVKMERAMAIARGETPPEAPAEQPPREQMNTRRLRMKTNFSTNRDMPVAEEVASEQAATSSESQQQNLVNEPTAGQSSTTDMGEQGVVEATQPLSPQFAALMKQKRAFQLEKAEFEKQRADLEAKANGFNPEEFKTRISSDPLGVLQEYGVTYDALTEAILSDKQQINPEIVALKQKIAELEKGIDSKFQTNEQRQEEAALTEMLYEVEALSKEGDDFEMIRSEDAAEQVLRYIHKTYQDTGRVLDVREAMNKIETQLLAKAEKLASIAKVRAKIAPPSAIPAQPAQRQGMRTLTARDTATPTMDRRARAIAAAMGTLKR